MKSIDNLLAEIKSTCIDGYFCAEHYRITPFNGTPKQSAAIFQTCFPSNNFSRKLVKFNPFLSPELKEVVKDSEKGLSEKYVQKEDGSWRPEYFPRRGLFLFHYPLRTRRVVRNLRNGRSSFTKVEPEFVHSFKERYAGASVLYLHPVWPVGNFDKTHIPESKTLKDLNLPLLVGPRDTLNDLLSFVRESYGHIFSIYERIIDPSQRWGVDVVRDNCSAIHLYDSFKKPKEVHLEK